MESQARKLTTRELKALNTKKKLFQATLELMKNKGYDNFTIREVCKIAGTSTGSFYNYFDSKEQLLSFYYEMAGEDFEQHAKMYTGFQNPIEKITSFYVWYAGYTTEFGLDFCRLFFSSTNSSLNTDRIYNRVMEITLEYVQEAVEQQLIHLGERSCEETTKDLCVIFKGAIMDWCVHEGNYDLPQYVQHLLSIFIKGL
ncbi:TetR/AcrR family transcriptional regulator [Paenibacillus sp. 8b26]|uniref:TetR/AcrR family transcriptional regulator n=1 Tax=Paenibacillus sp. 8b26 TaxID=3424133 RepID=UPI003D65468E